jgi:predicted RNA-binding protein with PUA-like domain
MHFMTKQYWLLKSEPSTYSIDDLKRDRITYWEGVRNFQARNFLRDKIKKGDKVFFYHSNSEPSGIAGIAEVAKEGYPDPSQFNPKSKYCDSRASKAKPLWFVVDIRFVKKFSKIIPLEVLKKVEALNDMPVVRRGQRLSVQPVSEKNWKTVIELSGHYSK